MQEPSPDGIVAGRFVKHQVKSNQGPRVRQVLQVSQDLVHYSTWKFGRSLVEQCVNGNAGASSQGVGRSKNYVQWTEWEALHRALSHSQPIGLVQSAYIASLMRGDDTAIVAHQHRLLEERQNAAAQLGMHMYGFRVILKNIFATEDLDTVINQLVFRSQGNLQQFVDDRDLFIRVVGEIMAEFNLQQPPYTQSPQESRTQRPEMMQTPNGYVFLGASAHWTT